MNGHDELIDIQNSEARQDVEDADDVLQDFYRSPRANIKAIADEAFRLGVLCGRADKLCEQVDESSRMVADTRQVETGF